jgi:hypothetical protein
MLDRRTDSSAGLESPHTFLGDTSRHGAPFLSNIKAIRGFPTTSTAGTRLSVQEGLFW